MTKHFVDDQGVYLGGFDGALPPVGSIEVSAPPPHGLMVRQGAAWVDTPESIAAKRPALDLELLADALVSKGRLTRADIDGARR